MSITSDARKFLTPVAKLPKSEQQNVPVRVKIAKKTQTKPFIEPHHFNLDEFEYERNGTDPGRIIIFNQEIFEKHMSLEKRKGSRQDVTGIINCFQRQGFNINAEDVLINGSVEEVLNKIDAVVEDKKSLKETNSLIIFFLTHGLSRDTLSARDGELKCNDIWKKFIDCEELKGKPKMFVFQACKGNNYATISGENSVNEDPSALVNTDTFQTNYIGIDMLILYSSIEGNESYRDEIHGSWFIQELCKNLSSYGRRDDVISIATRTLKCISGNYYHTEENEILKQMPILVSTLSKKFYLNRNKDRHLLLEINNKQDEIVRLLEQLVRCFSQNR